MADLQQGPSQRVPSPLFNGGAFGFTAAALVLAPFLAAANIFHSYLPFLFLRVWVIGFCWYGILLARRAGGFRKSWLVMYVIIALPFALVWGLKVDEWALIDLASAVLIGLSAVFLRSEPPPRGAA
jgi:hypothetical protein